MTKVSSHVIERLWFLTLYARATQMSDRGPNPDLWMVTAGPLQPLKSVFYTKSFNPKFCVFGRTSKA